LRSDRRRNRLTEHGPGPGDSGCDLVVPRDGRSRSIAEGKGKARNESPRLAESLRASICVEQAESQGLAAKHRTPLTTRVRQSSGWGGRRPANDELGRLFDLVGAHLTELDRGQQEVNGQAARVKQSVANARELHVLGHLGVIEPDDR
jgi:hypothetical protein